MAKKISHYKTNSTLDKPEKQEEELEPCVVFVRDNWEKWDAHWANKLNKLEDYYNRWIGKPPKRDEDWQSDFHKRLTWQAVSVLVARFHNALFPVPAPIETDATETVDELSAIMSKSMVAHWFKIGRFNKEFLSAMKSSGIYGSGFFEDGWFLRKEKQFESVIKDMPDFRAMVDEQGNKLFDEEGSVRVSQVGTKPVKNTESRMKIVEDRYRVQKSSIFAWRIHPDKLSDEDNYPVIKQEFITYDDLLKKQIESERYGFGAFENMDKIKGDVFKIDESDVKRLQKDGDYKDDENPRLELLWYQGLYAEKEEDKKIPMWIMVINRKFKLVLKANPMWHQKPNLFHINWTEDEKPSYYGIGVAQIGASAEDRANSTVNIRTDMKKKNVRGSGWYNANDKKIKKSHLTKNTPGLLRPSSDPKNAVKYDDPPRLSTEDYKEEETAVNDHREITGATTSLLPPADKNAQPDTLGGMRLNLSQSIQRLKPDLSMMEIMGIRKMANRGFLLTRQFFSRSEAVELIASQDQKKKFQLEKVYKITPEDILKKVNFHCTGLSEALEKSDNIDKLLKYAEVTGKIPAMQAVTNYQGIGKQIGLWLGFENIEDFVQNPQQFTPPPVQQQVPAPGVPGVPGVPQVPGVPIPGQPPGLPAPGLPPEIIQMLVQRMTQGQQIPI